MLKYLKISYVQFFILAIGTLLVYGHTLDAPFYLDDFSSIQENPIIFDWKGTLSELWQFAPLRIIGYLSFALNYQLHQFQVAGYHIVNIIIHLLVGFAVWSILYGLINTSVAKNNLSKNGQQWLPLIVALIFILHPLHIQSVTYIVQRLASLAALFYFASMACFIQARLSVYNKQRIFWIIFCSLFALLAFFTKQNTFTLPIAFILIELLFFTYNKQRLLLAGIIALLSIIMVWILVTLSFGKNPFSLEVIQTLTRETTTISRTAYLATQMSVLWTYISLFFWSASSHIDYNYPITEHFLYVHENYHIIARFFHSVAIWALLGHLLLLSIALYNWHRRPLVAFGIFFYYLAHAIESSIIPIRDVIFEHRTYLPNLGLIILCSWLLVEQFPRWFNQRITQFIIIVLLIVLATITWQRNQMWRDPVLLWQHNIEQAPEKKRGWVILGKHLVQRGQQEKQQGNITQAKEILRKSIVILKNSVVETRNLDGSLSVAFTPEVALNLIVAYKTLGEYNSALKWIDNSLKLRQQLRPFDQAKFLVNQGNIFFELKRYAKAEHSYRQAIQVYPYNLKAQINLGSLLSITGRYKEAIHWYENIIAINPSNQYVKTRLQKLKALQR